MLLPIHTQPQPSYRIPSYKKFVANFFQQQRNLATPKSMLFLFLISYGTLTKYYIRSI